MSDDLVDALTGLLDAGIDRARTPEVARELVAARDRLHGPLRVAIAGLVKAGKSTLLNALLGEELAPTDAGECTRILTWYELGHTPRVVLHPRAGSPVQPAWVRRDGALEIELGTLDPAAVERISVTWPTNRLRRLTLLDTPGIGSLSTDTSQRTHESLSAAGDRVPVADAVLYLMRHVHASDTRFLEAFHDDELAQGTPMNAVGVISRADEIGSCRLDAMDTAARIADRYEQDPRICRLCPVIVPVNGLLAYAAGTLRESEYASLAQLARAPEAEVAALVLTADRFRHRRPPNVVTETDRAHLMDRLGLYGVRLGVDLIRRGVVTSATELAAELVRTSGLDRLRTVLDTQFAARSRVLRARSALAVLTAVLPGGCANGDQLAAAVEELTTSTHAFEEVRQLTELHAGRSDLRDDQQAELDRLLGGRGHDAVSRLGLPTEADPDAVRAAALTALTRWRRIAEHPLSSRRTQLAAWVVERSLAEIIGSVAR